MRVLITGGAGFIGCRLYWELKRLGHEVNALDSLLDVQRRVDLPPDCWITNICEKERVDAVFKETRPEVVCHLAAQISVSQSVKNPARDAETNVLGTINVLDAAVKHGTQKVVFASSGGVLYGNTDIPAKEIDDVFPTSPYGITKLAGEKYLEFYQRQYNLQTVALRYSNVYGPEQSPKGEAGVVAIFCEKILRGEPITIFGEGECVRDYVYVDDVVNANVKAITTTLIPQLNEGPVKLNIGTGVGTTVNEIARLVKKEIQRQFPRIKIQKTVTAPFRQGDLLINKLDPRLAEVCLDWKPTVKLADGIRRTVEWFGAGGNADS